MADDPRTVAIRRILSGYGIDLDAFKPANDELTQELLTTVPYEAESPGMYEGESLPPVARPPMFRPPTNVVGDAYFQRLVEDVFKFAPDLRGRVRTVQQGPTRGVMERLMGSGLSPYDFDRTNLMGQFDRSSKDVFIRPGLEPIEDEMVVAHELSHAGGNDELMARVLGVNYARRKQ